MSTHSQQSLVGWTESDVERDAAAADTPEPIACDLDVPATATLDEPARSESVDISGWNIYVVDSHSLIFQVFHALPEMIGPRGEHVAAVYGFVRDILQIIEQKQPDALICAFDRSGPTFRDA